MNNRIYLSPPHLGELEKQYVQEVFDSNWVAPVGPQISLFEEEFAQYVGARHAVAVSSGTAALHLALRYAGVGPGDEVLCSTLTFIASAAPITYLGAKPVFIDSDRESWNLDPMLLDEVLRRRAAKNHLPKALVVVHLYGQSAKIDAIIETCNSFGVTVVEDAAESLGARYRDRSPGTFGQSGIFSFNGNKIITTSGGGMLVTDDGRLADKARFWATQAKESSSHYEHREIGYNYRLSNVAAAIGRGQLRVLDDRVRRKRAVFDCYTSALADCPGIDFMPEPAGCYSTRWLTCITVDPQYFGVDKIAVHKCLADNNIESRPLWKPLHLQPVFCGNESYGGGVAEKLFENGLCLPSGTATSDEDYRRIHALIYGCLRA